MPFVDPGLITLPRTVCIPKTYRRKCHFTLCLLLTQASGELGPLPFVDPGLVANWGLPFVDPGLVTLPRTACIPKTYRRSFCLVSFFFFFRLDFPDLVSNVKKKKPQKEDKNSEERSRTKIDGFILSSQYQHLELMHFPSPSIASPGGRGCAAF